MGFNLKKNGSGSDFDRLLKNSLGVLRQAQDERR
jgi:hypothetical protein